MLICPLPPRVGISSLYIIVLLYGGECWIPLKKHQKSLNNFHHHCIHTILGITCTQQWEEKISSRMMREQWGNEETITTKLMRRHLKWLSHQTRMTPERIPKITLFSWLPQTHPQGGPRRRWRDLVKSDLKTVGIQERGWYEEAQHRKQWYVTCNEGLPRHHHDQQRRREMGSRDIKCSMCGWCFSRESDKARHKCIAEHQKPVQEQEGAVECWMCGHWLKSRGGLAVHRCAREEEEGQIFRSTLEDLTTESLAVRSPVTKTTRM